MLEKLKYLIALTHFNKFGPTRLERLNAYFSDMELAFKANGQELTKAGIEEKIASEFIAWRSGFNLEEIIKRLSAEGINVIELSDSDYPILLKEIYRPPRLLYYRGQLPKQNELAIAVVGTRKVSPYGQQATERLIADLVGHKLTITSGLAVGIDTIAHHAALNAKGKTIAVLGSGLDKQSVYPSSNRYLADKITTNGGLIISEFPIGTQPLKYNFPMRNRIISGLSLGTLVIEAQQKSGALITAAHALEQNREVFAVPGNIFSPNSIGPNSLIRQGAKIVLSVNDIIETLALSQAVNFIENKKIIPETAEEKIILSNLTYEPIHINELIRLTKLDTRIINSTLTIMEMKGMVRNLGGMMYILIK
jgi:DNA processing protein